MTPVLQNLVSLVSEGNCILFLGAGIHAPPPEDSPYRYPEEQRPLLGRNLAENLARKFCFDEEFSSESTYDLQRVSLFIETKRGLGRKTLVDNLDDLLRKEKKPSPALKMLSELPFKIMVTTNYDRLLESALVKQDKDPFSIVYDPNPDTPTRDMTEDPTVGRPLLFKMHGDLNHRESIVITDEDYITFVQRMLDKNAYNPVPQTVRFRMLRWPTLFIGYSLRDYNLRLLFRTLRWRVDTAEYPISYAVDREPDPLTLRVWQDERRIISFVIEDLWKFLPWLYKEVKGEKFPV